MIAERKHYTATDIEAVLANTPITDLPQRRMRPTDEPVPMPDLREQFRALMVDQKCIVRGCTNRVGFPGKCPSCLAAWEKESERDKTMARMVDSGMPKFKTADGKSIWPTFADVRPLVSSASGLRRVAALTHRSAVLTGGTGVGKTIAAMAWLQREIIRGASGLWVSAIAVVQADRIAGESGRIADAAGKVDVVVLDDWGMELAGALPNSGVASQRTQPMMSLLERCSTLRKPMFVTTGWTRETLTPYYGDAFVRRVFELPMKLGTVIDMGGA